MSPWSLRQAATMVPTQPPNGQAIRQGKPGSSSALKCVVDCAVCILLTRHRVVTRSVCCPVIDGTNEGLRLEVSL